MTFSISAWPGGPGDFTINTGPPAVVYPVPFDHVVRGRARLIEQFKPKPRINALVEAPLSALNDLEASHFQTLIKRLRDAEGALLDRFGSLFGVAREGRGDDAYRTLIWTWALAYRSNGTLEEIYAVIDRLSPDSGTFEPLPLDPASFKLSWTSPLLPNLSDSADDLTPLMIQRLLAESRAGAVKVWFFWWPRPFSNLFRLGAVGAPPSSLTGLGPVDGSTGGHMAGEVIA